MKDDKLALLNIAFLPLFQTTIVILPPLSFTLCFSPIFPKRRLRLPQFLTQLSISGSKQLKINKSHVKKTNLPLISRSSPSGLSLSTLAGSGRLGAAAVAAEGQHRAIGRARRAGACGQAEEASGRARLSLTWARSQAHGSAWRGRAQPGTRLCLARAHAAWPASRARVS